MLVFGIHFPDVEIDALVRPVNDVAQRAGEHEWEHGLFLGFVIEELSIRLAEEYLAADGGEPGTVRAEQPDAFAVDFASGLVAAETGAAQGSLRGMPLGLAFNLPTLEEDGEQVFVLLHDIVAHFKGGAWRN